MPVYFLAQVEIHDADGYDRYSAAAVGTAAILEDCGAKVLAVDDAPEILEGSWHGPRSVLMEFPSEEAFRSWYDSPVYQAAAKIRFAATHTNAVLVHGLG